MTITESVCQFISMLRKTAVYNKIPFFSGILFYGINLMNGIIE